MWNKRILILFVLFINYFNSVKSQTQDELNKIETQKLKIAEKELDSLYSMIITDYRDDIIFVENFIKSHLAWAKYRDAELKLKYPESDTLHENGSVYPFCKAIFLTNLTYERYYKLKEWLKPGIEGDICNGSLKIGAYQNNIFKVEKVKNISFAEFISEMKILKEIKTPDFLQLRILEMPNEAGSAGFPSGEITCNLYISVTLNGEIYDGNLYFIPNLYDIKIEKAVVIDSKTFLVSISFGIANERKTVNLKITKEKLTKL